MANAVSTNSIAVCMQGSGHYPYVLSAWSWHPSFARVPGPGGEVIMAVIHVACMQSAMHLELADFVVLLFLTLLVIPVPPWLSLECSISSHLLVASNIAWNSKHAPD